MIPADAPAPDMSGRPAGDASGSGPTTTPSRTGGLIPFRKGDGRAAAAGAKGAEVRRARRDAAASSARAVAAVLGEVRDTFDRETLGPDAAAAAGWVVAQVVAGKVPMRNADEAATLLRALVDVARLEAGQSTSNAVVAHVGPNAVASILELRDQARAALAVATDVVVADIVDDDDA